MNADEIVKALRCDVEQGNEGGSRCYREGEDCKNCPNYYEGGDHIMAIDEMMLAAADAIESLKAELKHYKRWVNDLQSGMYVNCVYCGHRYGPAADTPVSMADVLKEHIEHCPEHPMSKLKAQLAESQRREQAAIEDLHIHGQCCVCAHCDKTKYPAPGYCELGGCNGGGSGKIAEDRWIWRGPQEAKY